MTPPPKFIPNSPPLNSSAPSTGAATSPATRITPSPPVDIRMHRTERHLHHQVDHACRQFRLEVHRRPDQFLIGDVGPGDLGLDANQAAEREAAAIDELLVPIGKETHAGKRRQQHVGCRRTWEEGDERAYRKCQDTTHQLELQAIEVPSREKESGERPQARAAVS